MARSLPEAGTALPPMHPTGLVPDPGGPPPTIVHSRGEAHPPDNHQLLGTRSALAQFALNPLARGIFHQCFRTGQGSEPVHLRAAARNHKCDKTLPTGAPESHRMLLFWCLVHCLTQGGVRNEMLRIKSCGCVPPHQLPHGRAARPAPVPTGGWTPAMTTVNPNPEPAGAGAIAPGLGCGPAPASRRSAPGQSAEQLTPIPGSGRHREHRHTTVATASHEN